MGGVVKIPTPLIYIITNFNIFKIFVIIFLKIEINIYQKCGPIVFSILWKGTVVQCGYSTDNAYMHYRNLDENPLLCDCENKWIQKTVIYQNLDELQFPFGLRWPRIISSSQNSFEKLICRDFRGFNHSLLGRLIDECGNITNQNKYFFNITHSTFSIVHSFSYTRKPNIE